MRFHSIRLLSTLSIAGVASLVISCSLLPSRQTEPGQTNPTAQRIPTRRIAQIDFGRDASFAVCTEPACPAVTRKTLAVTRRAVLAVVATPNGTPHAAVIVLFASGSAALGASDKAMLDQAIPSIRQADHVVITGRTDNIGSSSANHAIALARVRTVRDYLRARLPVRAHTLTLNAQWACCFTASNDTPAGRRQNRRVEIMFSDPERMAP